MVGAATRSSQVSFSTVSKSTRAGSQLDFSHFSRENLAAHVEASFHQGCKALRLLVMRAMDAGLEMAQQLAGRAPDCGLLEPSAEASRPLSAAAAANLREPQRDAVAKHPELAAAAGCGGAGASRTGVSRRAVRHGVQPRVDRGVRAPRCRCHAQPGDPKRSAAGCRDGAARSGLPARAGGSRDRSAVVGAGHARPGA